MIYFQPDWRNCILIVQGNNLKWFFWKKSNLTNFFWSLNRNFSEFCRKTLGKVVKFSSVGPEVQTESFFWKILFWVYFGFWAYVSWFPIWIYRSYVKTEIHLSKRKFWKYFLWKNFTCVRTSEPEQKRCGLLRKESPWLSKLHCTYREVFFEEFVLYVKNRSSLSNSELKVLGTSAVDTRHCCVVKTPVNESKTTFLNFFMVEFHSQKYFRTLSETVSDR